jgi:surfeit locus 1 family protein
MTLAGRQFRPGAVLTFGALVLLAATVSLGQWQQRRAIEKDTLSARIDERGADAPVQLGPATLDPQLVEFRRVQARGDYAPELTVFLDNRTHQGVAGYQVLTPLRLAPRSYVLVNRGWIAAAASREVLPRVPTPSGVVSIEGIAVVPTARFLELAPDVTTGPVRQNLGIERLATELRIPLLPIVVQQTSDAPDGLVRAWERPDTGADRHRAYAWQWYAMAALTIVFYVLLGFRTVGRA